MKFCTSLLLSLFLLTTVAFGQKQDKAKTKNYVPTKYENSLLWQISGNELRQPSYLFGTIHMIGKEDFVLTDATREMLNQTQRITFEINMEDMNDLGSQLALMMDAFMKDGVRLKDLLSEEDYGVVSQHFEKMGLPLMFLDRIKPMFLSVFASSDMDMKSFSDGSMVSYEMELMKLAKEKDQEIGGLETAEYQMSMFDSIPYTAQAEMLVQSIKSGDSGNDQFKVMVDLYKNQDLIGMTEMLSSESEGVGEYEDLLLASRNRNWIPVMSEMMEDKPTFFAVGAGHLGGQLGVIALLRDAGYTLTPINPTHPKP